MNEERLRDDASRGRASEYLLTGYYYVNDNIRGCEEHMGWEQRLAEANAGDPPSAQSGRHFKYLKDRREYLLEVRKKLSDKENVLPEDIKKEMAHNFVKTGRFNTKGTTDEELMAWFNYLEQSYKKSFMQKKMLNDLQAAGYNTSQAVSSSSPSSIGK